jgi:VWFA-related protein
MKRSFLSFCVLAWGSVLVRAYAQGPQPAFTVEVNVVDLDATVTDAEGNFVLGLKAEDFEVFEDGQPQKVRTFAPVDIPRAAPTRFLAVDRLLSPDVRSNRDPVSGRIYLIVLDDLNISPLRITDVRLAARQFIESYFAAGDVAAVAYTSGRVDASQDFTSDAELLLASVDKFIGRAGQSAALEAAEKYYEDRLTLSLDPPAGVRPDDIPQLAADLQDSRAQTLGRSAKPTVDIRDFQRAQRVMTVLDTMKALAQSLSSVRGRKAVVMFSEGFNYQLTEPFGMRSVSDVLRATQDTLNAAARANVTFYAIDPRGLVGAGTDFMQMSGPGMPQGATQVAILDELRNSRDSLRVLAEETGGFAALDTNSFASAFERISDSSSQYYLLGYTRPNHPADGQFHKIDVRVKRPGLRVVARRGYAVPGARTAEQQKRDEAARLAREARRPDGDDTSAELRRVLEAAVPQPGLHVSVHAAAFRNTDREASVAMAIEIDGASLPFSPPGAVELSFYAVNEHGRAGPGVRKQISLALKPETIERVKASGLRLNPRIALPPGRHQLRIGVRETSTGQSGSVFYDVIVPNFRNEPVGLSGLLVTSVSAQNTPTAEPDPTVSNELPGAATSRREFPVGDTLAVYAELYDNRAPRQAREVEIAVRLIAEDGRDVFTAKDSMVTDPSKPSNIFAQFALEDLSPGGYLLRVEAQPRGAEAGTLAREALITVVP